MCTPLETFATMVLDATLKNADMVDVAPLHKDHSASNGDTVFVLRAHIGGSIAILGRVYPPYEQDDFVESIFDILPEGVQKAVRENMGRNRKVEDMFPDDPAHPKNRGKRKSEAPDNTPAPSDILRRLMGESRDDE